MRNKKQIALWAPITTLNNKLIPECPNAKNKLKNQNGKKKVRCGHTAMNKTQFQVSNAKKTLIKKLQQNSTNPWWCHTTRCTTPCLFPSQVRSRKLPSCSYNPLRLPTDSVHTRNKIQYQFGVIITDRFLHQDKLSAARSYGLSYPFQNSLGHRQ